LGVADAQRRLGAGAQRIDVTGERVLGVRLDRPVAVSGGRGLPVRDVRLPAVFSCGEVRDLAGFSPFGRPGGEDEQGCGERPAQNGNSRRMSGPGHFDLLDSSRVTFIFAALPTACKTSRNAPVSRHVRAGGASRYLSLHEAELGKNLRIVLA